MAVNQRPTVVGVFENRTDAERAVNELNRAGFRDDQIGFATKDGDAPRAGRSIEGQGTGEAGEGAAKGAVGGGIVGGILGALATGLIPGVGPIIAGGLLAGVLGGVAVGAATGGIFGALVGSMGVPEEEARYYDEEFRSGRTLVTVKADGRYDDAYRILQQAGAYDFETRGDRAGMTAAHAADTSMGQPARPMTGRATTTEGERTIPLHEEQLRVQKETEQTGEVAVRKDVVAREETVDVPVRREEVFVERHPVDDARPADRPIGEGQTIEVPVHEERVEVEKQPFVYEEVEIGKRQVQETEHVAGTVRREEAHVEREGDVTVHDAGMGTGGVRSWDEIEPTYRQAWEQRYGTSGMRWNDVEPYRRYSYEMGNDPRYRGRNWAEVERDLHTNYGDWSRRHGYRYDESAWDRFKDQMRSAWEETGQTVRGR